MLILLYLITFILSFNTELILIYVFKTHKKIKIISRGLE